MTHFKGEVHKTNEGTEQSATTYASAPARGGGRGRGRGKGGSGMMDGSAEHKRRRLRVDALGNREARLQKMRVLHRLMVEGGGDGATEDDGLHPAIINLEPPKVRNPAASAARRAALSLALVSTRLRAGRPSPLTRSALIP